MLNKRIFSDYLFTSINYLILFILGCITIFPFLNLLAISLNDSLDTLRGGIYLYPRIFTMNNYQVIFNDNTLFGAALRSIIRTVLGTGLGIVFTSMIAYALCRKEFILRKQFNLFLILTLYVNGGLIPYYLLVKELGLMNHFAVYIIPGLISAFHVIIMRSYFEQLPDGIVESAKIDGAHDFQVLFKIVIPISMPVIATITLFIAVGHWNAWFDNYLFASRNENLSLLQYELMKILIESTTNIQQINARVDASNVKLSSPESIRAAMTIIATVPILFVYPFLQRYFVKGMTFAAMKE